MTWLIGLYPPAWRRRYGRELAELMATQPASFGTAIDLVAGAVDAWLNPQSSTAAAAEAKGAGEMIPKMLQLTCAGHGPVVTAADRRKAAMVTIGGTLVLTLALLGAMMRYGRNPYLESFLAMSWLGPVLISQRFTTLKERPARVQAVLIAGPATIVIAIALATAWINALARS